jgi:hypothetical protein
MTKRRAALLLLIVVGISLLAASVLALDGSGFTNCDGSGLTNCDESKIARSDGLGMAALVVFVFAAATAIWPRVRTRLSR